MTMNVAYSCMDNYAQHAGVSILSLLENNKDIDEICVYIIDNHISEENKDNLRQIVNDYGRKIVFVDLYELSKSLKSATDFCRSTYGKLFFPELEGVDRMLSFDCDTVVTGSLKDLLEMDMTDTLVAGVQDTVNPYFVHKIGLTNKDRYINCGGVIVLNLDLWRKMGTEKLCVDYVEEFNGNPPFVDQGTINKFCKDNKQILSPKYNVINPMFMYSVKQIKKLFKMETYYSQEEIDDAKENPLVIHFTGELYNRPWFSNCTHPLKDEYVKYLKMSPWSSELTEGDESKNGKIQKFVYYKCPFFVYRMMIKFIEVRHKLTNRSMVGK